MGSNVQKMRDAPEMMIFLFDKGVICTSYANTPEEMEQIEELYRKAKSALSLPLCNCDVGTAEEQFKRYDAFCRCQSRGCRNCPANVTRIRGTSNCDLAWAQMPYEAYEEGGAK